MIAIGGALKAKESDGITKEQRKAKLRGDDWAEKQEGDEDCEEKREGDD